MFVLLLLCTTCTTLFIPEPTIPVDPSIRYGKLNNGLSYYIKKIDTSINKINMRLFVKVGFDQENKKELGYAHTLEHLAFKCSKHFNNHLLGASMNKDNNESEHIIIEGNTYLNSTNYTFDIFDNSEDALNRGLLWFHDISDLDLTKEKINSERNVLWQEVLIRQGNDMEDFYLRKKMNAYLFPCQNDFSNYYDHNSSYRAQDLKNFYSTWYQPDQMAIVIVGNISDVDLLEEKIKTRFSDIENDRVFKPMRDCQLSYLKRNNRYILMNKGSYDEKTTKESIEFNFYTKDPMLYKNKNNWVGLKRAKTWEVIEKLTNQRIKTFTETYNNRISAHAYAPSLNYTPAFKFRIISKDSTAKLSVVKIFSLLNTIKNFGFTTKEWENIKQELINSYTAKSDLNDSKSQYWIDQISNHYLFNEPLPKDKSNLIKQWIFSLTINDINNFTSQNLICIPNDIAIVSSSDKTFEESQVRNWIKLGLDQKIMPYKDIEIPDQLMSEQEKNRLELKRIIEVDRRTIKSIHKNPNTPRLGVPKGIKEFKLENGIQIILDTTGAKDKNVSIHGFSKIGASCFPSKDYFSAVLSPEIVKNAGANNLNKFELKRYREKMNLNQGISIYINYNESGIKAKVNANPQDLENIFQLIYIFITNPRKDYKAYKDWKSTEKNRYLNPTYSITNVDNNNKINDFIGDNFNTPRGTKKFEGTNQTEFEQAYKIYKKIFSETKDLTFIITGDISQNEIIPLIRKYLGNLPNKSEVNSCESESLEDYNIPQGPLIKTYPNKSNSLNRNNVKYSLRYIAKIEDAYNWKDVIKTRVISTLLKSKVMELRYKHNANIYSPSAGCVLDKDGSYYNFYFDVDCAPEDFKKIKKLMDTVIYEIKNESFSQTQITNVINRSILPSTLSRQNKSATKARNLYKYYKYGKPIVSSDSLIKYAKTLTSNDFKEITNKYINEKYRMEFVFQ